MFRMIVLLGIAATLLAVLGHYVLFGPKRLSRASAARTVHRFGLGERFLHLVTLAGFVTMCVSGLTPVIAEGAVVRGWYWLIHVAAAPVFIAGLVSLLASWAMDCRFQRHDWEWAKKFGGYLWGDKHAPADRFNAGQKAYLWAVALLSLLVLLSGLGRVVPVFDAEGQDVVYQIHRYSALLLVLAAITHLYLGTLANPGTLGSMILGKVTPEWAEHHHPIWRGSTKNVVKK